MGINRKDHTEGKIVIGTVEGGDQSDPDPQALGRVRVRETSVHGPHVKTNHLRFIQHVSPAGAGQYTTPRPERPGQDVHILKTIDGYAYVLGIAAGIGAVNAGNFDSLVYQIGDSIKKGTGMNIPPNIENSSESNETGLAKMTKEIVEKGEEDRHELYRGLPSHGASPSMSGLISNPVRQVSTAQTTLGTVLNSTILGQLPGTPFSLGNLLNLLTDDQKNELLNNFPPDLRLSFSNLMALKQTETNSSSLPGNFMLGGMVNPDTFIPNMITSLKNVTNFGELDATMHQLTASSLESSALDGLENLVSTVIGLFGEFSQTISPDGTFNTTFSHTFSLLQNLFTSTTSSIPAADGRNYMFGNDTQMTTMMERLNTNDNIKTTKRNLEKKHPDQNSKRRELTLGGTAGTTLGSKTFLA